MSLKTIVQNSADEVGVVRPTTVIGNLDPDVTMFLRLANKVGISLMKASATGWQALNTEKTFTSVATEEQVAILPSDFDRFLPETFWNRTADVLLSGPIGAVEWQGLKAGSYNNTRLPRFRYRGDGVLVIPTLVAGQSLTFEYVSKNWCATSGGTGQAVWAADSDVGVLSEELMTLGLNFQYLQAKGQPNASAASDFVELFNTILQSESRGARILVAGDIFGKGRHFDGVPSSGGSTLF